MHRNLTEHARCLYESEPCEAEHREQFFVEELAFAGPDEIVTMLRAMSPNLLDGDLPIWIRILAYRLAVLQRPDDPALLRDAANTFYFFGPDWDAAADDLVRRADLIDQARGIRT
jgi:hypothetical protein